MKTLLCFLLLGTVVGFSGCATGGRAFEKGRPEMALRQAANRLKSRPENAKALAAFRQAYPAAIEGRRAAIAELEATREAFRWEKILTEYEALQEIYDRLKDCSACVQEAGWPRNYAAELSLVRNRAAAARLNAGRTLMAYRTEREPAKTAYLHFVKADQLVPNYPDARRWADTAFQYALFRVVIEPVRNVYRLDRSDYRELTDELGAALFRSSPPSPFVRYLTPEAAAQDTLAPNEVVELGFLDYLPRREYVSEACTTVESTQEYVVGRKKINDSTWVDVKAKVKGRLTRFQKTVEARARMEICVRDAQTGRLLRTEPNEETVTWTDEWFRFSGDERALNGTSPKTMPGMEPSIGYHFSRLVDQLASHVRHRLRSWYQAL